ncbi:hypothetical protein Fmac_016128 [Flemingia macrophylla]|uniref:SET domain-containing protein n=1 Tax=Flemingia macrophylla TaxID=520843 RepID=A0ABD1MGJ6_9FABA
MEKEREMQMEMRSSEEIEIGRDVTPSLSPLSFSLHNSHLHTHCSSCFSPLPNPIPNPNPNPNSLFFCSPPCSAALPSSAHRHLPPSANSSDLRTALRLLRPSDLLSNRRLLTSRQHDDVSDRIRAGAAAMARAVAEERRVPIDDALLEEATVALCVVLTNAVEVHDSEGRALGIAVYDHRFSWINHSCSPNACFRFLLSSQSHEAPLRISPHQTRIVFLQMGSGVPVSTSEFVKDELGYGPRLVVRSIKKIEKGEEVTVAYTDLLQPKEISAFSCDSSSSCDDYKFLKDMADGRLTECIDDVISNYLSVGDPESCCEKLEMILTQGLNEQLEGNVGKSDAKFMLHPLHHLSLKAYTTLASAYKVCAGDLLSVDSGIDINQLKTFAISRTSVAYSLLLAGATHHLFNFEPSLIASVANFWTAAGESLLSLSRSSAWSVFVNLGGVPNLASAMKFKWSKCSLIDRFRACMSSGQIKSTDFENVSNEFLHCVSGITQKVWGFLISDCHFLRSCKDPIDFSWLMSTKSFSSVVVETCVKRTDVYYTQGYANNICEEETYIEHAVAYIFQLGIHCLSYGGLLASICYGPHSNLVGNVQNVLDREMNFVLNSCEKS